MLLFHSSVCFCPGWFWSSLGGPRWSTTRWTQISSGSSSWTTSLRRSRTCALTCEWFPLIWSSWDMCHFSPNFSIFPLFLPEFDLLRLPQSLHRSFFPASHLILPSPLLSLLLSAAQLIWEELFIGACLNSHPFKGEWYKDHKYFIQSFIPNLPAAKQSKYLNWILLKTPPLLSPTALLVLRKARFLREPGRFRFQSEIPALG